MAVRVRIVDIAAELGVSVSTVSKALANSNEIGPETTERVQAKAKALGYKPNGAARRLRTGRTQAVGLLAHDPIGWQSLPVLLGAEDAAGARDVSVLLANSRGDSIREKHHVRTMLEHGIDGIIVLGSDTNVRPSLGDVGVPVIYAYASSSSSSDYSIVPDESAGARAAMQLLLDLGRRHIGHITGPSSYAAAVRRAIAAESTMRAHGLQFAGGAPLRGDDWTEGWGRVAAETLLRKAPDLDAIFCGSDSISRGVLEVLRTRNVRVPEDIAIVSFDNDLAIATNLRPTLTSVDMNLEFLGETAVAALFDAIEGRPRHGVEHLACRLVMRASTSPA